MTIPVQLIQTALLVFLAAFQTIRIVAERKFRKSSPNPGSGRCLSSADRVMIRQTYELVRAICRRLHIDI